MRQFRLADAALADLGAGRPSPATLGLLRRAQLSRNLLLLRQLRRSVTEKPIWYARLAALSPQDARTRIVDPMTGLWAAHALTTPPHGLDAPLEPVGHLLTVTCAGRELTVRLDDRSPLRHLLGLPPADPLTAAEVTHWQECLEAAWRILVTRHPAAADTLAAVLRVIVPARPDPLAEGVSATSAEAFGAVAMSTPITGTGMALALLHETQHSVLNAVNGLFDLVEPGGAPGYSPWREDPRPASGILHGVYAFLAVTRFWRTAIRAGGAPAGSEAEFEFARWRTAVHETAGRLLRAGEPTTGIARQAAGEPTTGTAPQAAGEPITGEARPAAGEPTAVGTRPAAGELTAAGRRLVGALRDEVEPWLAEPLDPEVTRLADLARTDHHARWRLRNLAIPAEGLKALVSAWAAERPAPAVESTVAERPRREEPHHRLRLIRARLRGDHRFPAEARETTTAAADDACLDGRWQDALTAYATILGQDRDDAAAWSGLALVSPLPALRRRPELVRAAAAALPGADIAVLAAWLSR
ncbi:hypothetical protein ACWT_1016 [Actinoplanes sp. SE50]|uniref:aKG-HExxH-type peptide beta-hydroxylase n=1 Tax=unclassified Actinoplanes TaxID=2626549 RepID=UPI00023ECA82|nr:MULTISPECIES: HEXXH motif-containing putative peptide modification protein [unclassified Actinoplanes]AEV82032.1 hypothetical protein ACPL_1135 [Actinoplanes sp. SE50/110]ATO80431.1 hypothetical protein ACWT_1016 [Actinoplanes sp. SE50]SLL97838.1 HEXXH motif domain-containing protein [Actinoplanes sp. SE50/110]